MNERDIFIAARQLQAPQEQNAYLDKACGGDHELRRRIVALLEEQAQLGSFLEHEQPLAATLDAPHCERRGSVIGPYKLIEQIGEGGMAVVWMAQQTEPVKRLVALKLIKAGMASKQLIARFEAERQALALMDHPNIAKVFDGGTIGTSEPRPSGSGAEPRPSGSGAEPRPSGSGAEPRPSGSGAEPRPLGSGKAELRPSESGKAEPRPSGSGAEPRPLGSEKAELRPSESGGGGPLPYGRGSDIPYFVMDLVKGVPITRYCDEHRLTVRERLELFLPVCQAVQHAHQKGIIHRDIKPSNVLVALYDGKPVPKVIDFGVAKAIGQPLTEQTLVTGFGAIVGTLEYMSPEQAEINQLDVDTRSDIYSLGVLLYELLTGTTPLEHRRVKESGLIEALRIIREEEVPTLSNRLSSTAELPAIAANRGTEPVKLTKLVRGELDWILMKALEKDRNRRYETAGALAADVQRYLADEPVQACPPSWGYRLRKFLRRNKGPVVGVAAVLLVLVGGIIGTTTGLVRARRAEAQARERLEAAQAARREALENLRKLRQAVDDYFVRVSDNTLLQDPNLELLRVQLLQDALHYYQDFVRTHGADPELEADVAATYLRVGALTYEVNPNDDWLPYLENAVVLIEDLLDKEVDLSAFASLRAERRWCNSAGVWYYHDREAVFRFVQKARTVWERLVRQYPEVPSFQSDLATLYLLHGAVHEVAHQNEEALLGYEKAARLYQELSKRHPDRPHYRVPLAIAQVQLSTILSVLGRYREAERHSQQALGTAQQLVAEFPDVPGYQELLIGYVQTQIAWLLQHAGRLGEAEEMFRTSLADQTRLMEQYPRVARYRKSVLATRFCLGEMLWGAGRHAEATEILRSYSTIAAPLDPEDPYAQAKLAWFLATSADPQFRDARRAVAIAEKLVVQVPRNGDFWAALGAGYYGTGDYPGAVRALRKATELGLWDWPCPTLFLLAMSYWQKGDRAQAREWYERAIAWMRGPTDLRAPMDHRLREEAETLLGISEP